MKLRVIHRETWVNSPPQKVFDFFTDIDNLDKVTSGTIPIIIRDKENIEIKQGAEIDLKMKLYGFLPISWKTQITKWDPPYEFVDIQPRGPYRYWSHTHRFISQNGGTLIIDEVEFAVPGYFLESLIYHIFVKNSLKTLFDYRQEVYPLLLDKTIARENA